MTDRKFVDGFLLSGSSFTDTSDDKEDRGDDYRAHGAKNRGETHDPVPEIKRDLGINQKIENDAENKDRQCREVKSVYLCA